MPQKPKTKSKTGTKTTQEKPLLREVSIIKLQIAATVFVPMLALGLWLNSKGFFG